VATRLTLQTEAVEQVWDEEQIQPHLDSSLTESLERKGLCSEPRGSAGGLSFSACHTPLPLLTRHGMWEEKG